MACSQRRSFGSQHGVRGTSRIIILQCYYLEVPRVPRGSSARCQESSALNVRAERAR